MVVNTYYCLSELDTLQYVIDRCGYKETGLVGEGNVYWYGLALKDRDVDMIRLKKSYYNRYPLMDVSLVRALIHL